MIGLSLLRGVPAAGIREYLGNNVAELLDVPKVRLSRLVYLPPRLLNRLSYRMNRDSLVARGMTQWVGRRLFRGFLACERGSGSRPSFEVSDALREQLRLK
jgi:hypothetical protein